MPVRICMQSIVDPRLAMLAWIAGNLVFQQWPTLPEPTWWAWLPCALVMAFYGHQLKIAGWFCLGFAWSFLVASWQIPEDLPENQRQQVLRIEGSIASIPVPLDDGVRFRFLSQLSPSDARTSLLQLNWRHPPQKLHAGEYWTLEVRLKPPHGLANPNSYDQERQFYSQHIRATGHVTAHGIAIRHPEQDRFSWQGVRQGLNDRIEEVLGQHRAVGLIQGLVLGATQNISDHDWEILRITGTTHLIAISGSHIGLIAFITLKMIQPWLGLRPYRKIPPYVPASLAACAAAIFYTALADWAVAALRALVMCLLIMFGVILQRSIDHTRLLLQALLIMSIVQPLALLSPGCWLSFGAIICLTLPARDGKNAGLFREMLHSNWRCALGLAPLLLYFFGQVSLISPLANGLAVPIIGMLLTPLALLFSLLLIPLPGLGTLGLSLVAGAMTWVMEGLELMSTWHGAQWLHARPPLLHTLLASAGIMILLLPRGFPGRILAPLYCLPAILWCPERPEQGHYHATVLDVGQGLAMVIQTQHHVLVYDTGPAMGPSSDSGLKVVLPFLRDQGYERLDMMIISHHDNDHSGGAASIAHALPVATLLAGEAEKLKLPGTQHCRHDQRWIWDGVTFSMAWPEVTDLRAKGNNRSCVLRVSSPQGSLLMTGDIERKAEAALSGLSSGGLQSDILIAPHHGSKTSSSSSLLEAVNPKWVVFASGYLNHFHHPHPEVLARYRQRGIHDLNTAEGGAILIRPVSRGDQGFSIVSQRDNQPHYWYHGRH